MTARSPEFVALLRDHLRHSTVTVEPLARYTTYRIGGTAAVVSPGDFSETAAAAALAHKSGVPWLALGLGSNVLIPDEGLDALVIRIGKGIDQVEVAGENLIWRFGAGLPAPTAAKRTARAGAAGLHMMIGVPGTVGGGVYMNAGCHGGQWSEVVRSVLTVDCQGEFRHWRRSEIPFGYRRSGLGEVIVVEAEVELRQAPAPELELEMQRLLAWRQTGTPFQQPCCGSVFTNPGGSQTAGRLIDAAGCKGWREGNIVVSELHANYFVNLGGGTAAQVSGLMARVRDEVHARFGVELMPELRLVSSTGHHTDPLPEFR